MWIRWEALRGRERRCMRVFPCSHTRTLTQSSSVLISTHTSDSQHRGQRIRADPTTTHTTSYYFYSSYYYSSSTAHSYAAELTHHSVQTRLSGKKMPALTTPHSINTASGFTHCFVFFYFVCLHGCIIPCEWWPRRCAACAGESRQTEFTSSFAISAAFLTQSTDTLSLLPSILILIYPHPLQLEHASLSHSMATAALLSL